MESDGRNAWENMIQWARKKLVDRGLIDNSVRGVWTLTQAGIQYAFEQGFTVLPNPHQTEDNFEQYIEGKMIQINVNRFERDPLARKEAIKYHGVTCKACNFNFQDKYGDVGKDFIHIHHVIPLHVIKKEYKVNPKKDLIPLCANCHAIVHRSKDALTVEELKMIIQEPTKP